MTTVTTTYTGRTWYGKRLYSVTVADSTGNMTFHDFSRTDANTVAVALGPLIGGRPIGPIVIELNQILGR